MRIAIVTPHQNPEELEVPGLQFMFASKDAAHYRSARTRVLDETLGVICNSS